MVFHRRLGQLLRAKSIASKQQRVNSLSRLNSRATVKESNSDTPTCSARMMSSDSTSIETLSHYGFWKERYKNIKNSTSFDWFVDSSLLLENIDIHLRDLYKNTSHPILRYLELGCGNSELPVSVYRESLIPVFVLAMDYVTYASQQQYYHAMNTNPKNSESHFQAICGDVMKMPFKSDLFDIAVDKGTMDALLKNKENGLENSCVMLSEVMRALAPGGRYIQISDEDPDSRLDFLHKISQWIEQLPQNSKPSIVDNVLFEDSYNPSENISYMNENETCKDHYLQNFQDIREDVKMSIKQNERYKSPSTSGTRKKNGMCNSWRFKVIADEECNKEYFIYWTEKT